MDIGCGQGTFTDRIRSETAADVLGVDVSPTAIAKARLKYPLCRFEASSAAEIETFAEFKPTAICMFGVTWYMLDCFRDTLAALKDHYRGAILFHALAFYGPGKQSYGTEHFTCFKELLPFFSGMEVEETFVRRLYPDDGSYQTLLIARI
jgi:ubiquinone/menaquinone biosynthesis C-methylase UbiE